MDRRKRVLFMKTTYLNPTETFIYERIKNIRKYRGYFMSGKTKNLKEFPYRRLYKMGRRNISRFLKKKRIKLIQTFFGNSSIQFLPYSRKTGIPMISSFHGKDVSVLPNDRNYRRKIRRVFKHSERVMVVSEDMKKRIIHLGCRERKIRVIKTGIDLRKFLFKRVSPPRDRETTTFLSIGRLVQKKGMDILIKAFAKVHRKDRRTELVIIGEGEMRPYLKRLIQKYHLGSAVRLKGRRSHEQVRKHLDRAHVFVLASRTAEDGDQEGIPNSLVEAMAYGLPVISTYHSGIPELIEDGRSGLLAKEGSVRDLARKMREMLKQKRRWRKYALAARATVEQEHDIRRQVKKMEKVYQEIL